MMNAMRMAKIEKPEIKKKIKESETKTPSKLNTVIVSAIIILIFSYIAYDFFIATPKIDNKIIYVSKQFDSLKTHLDKKLPEIDKAIKIQEQQVKDLQQLSTNYIKK